MLIRITTVHCAARANSGAAARSHSAKQGIAAETRRKPVSKALHNPTITGDQPEDHLENVSSDCDMLWNVHILSNNVKVRSYINTYTISGYR